MFFIFVEDWEVMVFSRVSVGPAIRLAAFSLMEISETHGGFISYYAHTHSLRSVDVPFGGYDLSFTI